MFCGLFMRTMRACRPGLSLLQLPRAIIPHPDCLDACTMGGQLWLTAALLHSTLDNHTLRKFDPQHAVLYHYLSLIMMIEQLQLSPCARAQCHEEARGALAKECPSPPTPGSQGPQRGVLHLVPTDHHIVT